MFATPPLRISRRQTKRLSRLAVGNPYRAVRLYHGIRSARAGSMRARGRLAHACAMRSGARSSELLYASIRRCTVRARGIHARGRMARSCMSDEKRASSSTPVLAARTATSSWPRRVHLQDDAICPQVVQLPQFVVHCAGRQPICSSHFSR
jgi:hypothetical protein